MFGPSPAGSGGPIGRGPFGSSVSGGTSSGESQFPAGFGSSGSSPFGSPSIFGQNGRSTSAGPSFGGTSNGAFGTNSSPFGSGSAFGASSSAAFGTNSSPFGSNSAFGASSIAAFGTNSSPFGSAFGASSNAACGTNSTFASGSAFGAPIRTNYSVFGAPLNGACGTNSSPFAPGSVFGASSNATCGTNSSPFESGSAFGAPSNGTFGTNSSPFGSGSAFGASSNAAFGTNSSPFTSGSVFGAPSNGAFGTSSSPFGSGSVFGASSNAAFGTSTKTCGDAWSNAAFRRRATSSSLSPPAFGAHSTTQSSGSNSFDQFRGSRNVTDASTANVDGNNPTHPAEQFQSISSTPAYKEKSHEELRWNNYQFGVKGCSQSTFSHPSFTMESPSGALRAMPELSVETLMPKLRHSDYYTDPKIQELAMKEMAEPGFCRRVSNFVVGRRGYGSIKFLGETNVEKLELNSVVQFNYREIVLVYANEDLKPLVGQGLNMAAEVTLLNVKCIGKKSGKQYVDGPKVDEYKQKLIKKAKEHGGEFVSYDPVAGEWKFRVVILNQTKVSSVTQRQSCCNVSPATPYIFDASSGPILCSADLSN